MEIHGSDQAKNQRILDALRAFGFKEIKGKAIDEQDVHCFKNERLIGAPQLAEANSGKNDNAA